LSASADYNVVAIENFSPPKQFVPGQTVKKEEAVTNTGSIDAFVKQTISGVLEVTVEVPTTVDPESALSEKGKYIKYEKQNEWGAIEAGSMLAWAPSTSANKPGVVIGMGISGQGEGEPAGATGDPHDFDPDVTGLYVFRRAVDKDATVSKDLDYDYVAYYYVAPTGTETKGTYYKVYALKVDEGQIDTSDYLTAGILKKEPAYTYSKAVTTYANKQDMYYQKYTDPVDSVEKTRLVVKFNGRNTVDAAIAAGAEHTNKEIYDAYNVYETHNVGETVYAAPATGGTYGAYTTWNETDAANWSSSDDAWDTNNTGLTTYDIYNKDLAYVSGTDDVPAADLSNFGLKRLKELQTQTDTALDTAEAGYSTLQEAARTSRKTVNEGRDAQVDLAAHLTNVYAKVGQAATPSGINDSWNVTGNEGGLYLKETAATGDTAANDANTYLWQIYMITDGDAITVPTYNETSGSVGLNGTDEPAGFVKFAYENTDGNDTTKMAFANNSDGLTGTALTKTMTADNVNEKRFADPGSTRPATGWPANGDSSGVKWAAVTAPATEGSLVSLWNNYVYQTQRKVLNLKKQELVKAVIADGTGVKTDVGRSVDEAKVYLKALEEELEGIETDLLAAKTAYETEANSIRDEVSKMNACQIKVDNANKQYNGYLDATDPTGYAKPNATVSTNIKEVTAAKVVNGTETDRSKIDTPAEDAFEGKLKTIFGVAELDNAFTYTEQTLEGSEYIGAETSVDYESDYACDGVATTHTADDDQATGHATDVFTYSVKATKDKIDNSLEQTDKTVTVANGAFETVKITTFKATPYDTTAQTAIKSAPYWKDYVTDKMVEFRTGKKDAAYDAYEQLLKDNAMLAEKKALVASEGKATTDEVKLYVNLANVVETVDTAADETNRDKWQYVGDSDYSTDKSAKEFVFGYTGILEAGETSSLLIKSVEFDEDTTQDSFRDLKFDINVLVESAQAVYNANRVESTAAKEGITVISPTEADYASVDEAVKWAPDTTSPTQLPKDNDPNPKDVDVAPKKYTVGGEAVATPVELGTPITVDNDEYKYAIVVAGKTYYGTDKTDGIVYKEANADGTGLAEGGATVTLNVE